MDNAFEGARRLFTVVAWTLAISLSILLNLGLFSLMPKLLTGGIGEPEPPLAAKPVHVIRVKKQTEDRKKKKEIQKAVEKRKEPEKRKPKPPTRVRKVTPRSADLPFKPARSVPRPLIDLPDIPLATFAVTAPVEAPVEAPALVAAPSPAPAPSLPTLKDSYGTFEIDNPLIPLAQGPPLYPFSARRRGVTGAVKVKFLVGMEGRVEKVRILESNPGKIFDASVVKCVSAWRFTPGTVGGRKVKTWASTTIKFELE